MPAVIKPPIPNPPAIKPAVEEINEAALTTSEILIRGSYFRDIMEKTLQKITYRAVITRFDRDRSFTLFQPLKVQVFSYLAKPYRWFAITTERIDIHNCPEHGFLC